MKKWMTSLNVLFLLFLTPVIVRGATLDMASGGLTRNDALRQQVGITIRNVLGVWCGIGAATMILSIIAGAALMILSGTNPKLRESGKSLVLGSGITITLLLSSYAITGLVLSIFGIYMF